MPQGLPNITIHVLRAGWTLKPSLQPYIEYIAKDSESNLVSKTERIILSEGIKFNHSVTSDMLCIGFEPARGKWNPCPYNNKTIANQEQCQSCSVADFYSCRITCQGQFCRPTTTAAKALCDINETITYLTFVGGNYKVGVSLNPEKRWAEQGSLFSTILFKGNGLTARYHENALSTFLNLRLAVQNRSKLNFIGKKIDQDLIYAKMHEYIDKIEASYPQQLNSSHEIMDLRPYYGKIPFLAFSPHLETTLLKGTLIGVQGSLMVLQDKSTYYAINMKEIVGHIIVPGNINPKIKRQRGLLDF